MAEKIYDLEERLIRYAVLILDVAETIPRTKAGEYLSGQLTRSGLSPAFNYSESQAAESSADFIHKLSIVLKELKECRTALKILYAKNWADISKTEDSADRNKSVNYHYW